MSQLARGRAGKFLLLAISLLFALLLAEGALRVYEKLFVDRGVRFSGTGVDLEANNFNDGFVSFAKSDGEFRILSFGDSFAYATVRYPWSYHAIISEQAGSYLGDTTVRVVNLGEPAISFAEYLVNYQFWSGKLEHDAALFLVFVGNDLLRVRQRDKEDINRVFADMEFGIAAGERRLGRVPERYGLRLADYLYALWGSWVSRLPEREEADERYNFAVLSIPEAQFEQIQLTRLQNYDPSSEVLDAGFDEAELFFRAVAEIRNHGVDVLVALAPDQLQVDEVLRGEVLERMGATSAQYDFAWPNRRLFLIRDAVAPEIPMVDLLPIFECARDSGETHYRPRDTHWSLEGNRVAGTAIAQAMRWYWFEEKSGAMPSPACDG